MKSNYKINVNTVISGLTCLISFFICLPLILVVFISFSNNEYLVINKLSLEWYKQVFSSLPWLYSGINSLLLALMSSVISLVLGFITSYALIRLRSERTKKILFQVILFPLAVPVVIYATSIFLLFSHLDFTDNIMSLCLSQIIIIAPFSVVLFYISLLKYFNSNPNVISAAQTMGAKNITIFFRVILPHFKYPATLLFILCFLLSLNESVITQFISDTKTVTLAKKIFTGVKYDINPEIAVISTLLLFLSITLFMLIIRLFKSYSK